MHVVSIMAHQDDEMHCLGTMLKCRKRGDKLFFITLTDGSNGFVQSPDISREKAAIIRHREMSALAKACSAAFINIKERDEFLYDTPRVRMKLVEAIRKIKPELIFTHYEKDYNLDHTTVCALARQCSLIASLPVLPTSSPPLKAHPAVFMIEPHGPIEFTPTDYVDITDYHEEKTKLLGRHISQEKAMEEALGHGLGALCAIISRFRGLHAGCKYAEAFVPMRTRGAMKAFNVLP